MHKGAESVTERRSPVAVTVDELLDCRRIARCLQARPKHPVAATQVGAVRSRQLGRGLDFSELRMYQAGDDIRQIDWNVTARTGKPHTKLFSLERERPHFVVLDARPGMFFATRGAFKSVVAARLAAVLAWTAVLGNDRVGGLVFGEHGHREIKPDTGRRGVMPLFRAIVELTDPAQASAASDAVAPFTDGVRRLSRLVHTGSQVYFFSDFAGFDTRAKAAFAALMQHNSVTAVHIADVLETALPPPGDYSVRAAGGGRLRVHTQSRQARHAYQAQFADMQTQLAQFFTRGRHRYVSLLTNGALDDQAAAVLAGRSAAHPERADG